MKTIGLIGGMSWESSAHYYEIINEEVKKRLGGSHSAKCILYSVDFHEIEECQRSGQWDRMGVLLNEAAKGLEAAGAECLILCTNTMHKVADAIQAGVSIPLLHIADVTAGQVLSQGIETVGLLGTKYTMEQDFYKSRLEEQGLNVLVPGEQDREAINYVIYNELCLGQLRQESREKFKSIIEDLANQGVEGVILGCTEIGLLIKPEDSQVPVFDTTEIHALGAVDWSLD